MGVGEAFGAAVTRISGAAACGAVAAPNPTPPHAEVRPSRPRAIAFDADFSLVDKAVLDGKPVALGGHRDQGAEGRVAVGLLVGVASSVGVGNVGITVSSVGAGTRNGTHSRSPA